MPSQNFKVIIAGGSIAGLSLAIMLEKIGIDFVVLEAYSSIAPQVGASIGIMPNGLRILDQLGLHSAVRGLIDSPSKTSIQRMTNGKVINRLEIDGYTKQRHGYDVIFVDRQRVIQVLYDHLKAKHKVFINKKVVRVEQDESIVKAIIEDGSEFVGDIIVGADGVHSAVRREMWRIADQVKPGYIPASERTALASNTTYKCIFGISVKEDFPPFTQNTTWNKHSSHLVLTGPNHRIYWFLFQNIGEKIKDGRLPRYTKEEEQELANEHWNDMITDKVSFGDLYDTRICSTLTPLPEYVFKKWHFGRIMTIGDAAHKFEPISGQGGNNAIESAAALVNNLEEAMRNHSKGLSDATIDDIFSLTQRQRMSRVSKLVEVSHAQQKLEALETSYADFLVKYILRHLPTDILTNNVSSSIEGAIRLNMLSIPKRFHYVPYMDELTSKPFETPSVVKLAVAGTLLGIFRISQYALRIPATAAPPTFSGYELKQKYTGMTSIDALLSRLTFAFSGGVAGDVTNQRVQCFYFLIMLIPMVLIWTIESYRNGNRKSLVSMPVFFGVAFQLKGIGKIAPLYYLVSIFTSSSPIYTRTSGRAIPLSIAKALLPALYLAYILPSILMVLPYEDTFIHQNFVALWQPFPIYMAVLTRGISAVIARFDPKDKSAEMFELRDLVPLRITFGAVFFITACAHIGSLIYIFSNASLSVQEAFFNLPALVNMPSDLFSFFKYDMVLCFAAVLVWCLYSIFELRRTGYVTSTQVFRAALTTIAAQFVVGPGAAYTGVWAWREESIAKHTVIE